MLKKITWKARGYLRENLGAPFIIGFIILILITAILPAYGLNPQAERVAVYAYYLLVAGVILQHSLLHN